MGGLNEGVRLRSHFGSRRKELAAAGLCYQGAAHPTRTGARPSIEKTHWLMHRSTWRRSANISCMAPSVFRPSGRPRSGLGLGPSGLPWPFGSFARELIVVMAAASGVVS